MAVDSADSLVDRPICRATRSLAVSIKLIPQVPMFEPFGPGTLRRDVAYLHDADFRHFQWRSLKFTLPKMKTTGGRRTGHRRVSCPTALMVGVALDPSCNASEMEVL